MLRAARLTLALPGRRSFFFPRFISQIPLIEFAERPSESALLGPGGGGRHKKSVLEKSGGLKGAGMVYEERAGTLKSFHFLNDRSYQEYMSPWLSLKGDVDSTGRFLGLK